MLLKKVIVFQRRAIEEVTGWDGAAVSIEACGASDPSSNLGLDLYFSNSKHGVM